MQSPRWQNIWYLYRIEIWCHRIASLKNGTCCRAQREFFSIPEHGVTNAGQKKIYACRERQDMILDEWLPNVMVLYPPTRIRWIFAWQMRHDLTCHVFGALTGRLFADLLRCLVWPFDSHCWLMYSNDWIRVYFSSPFGTQLLGWVHLSCSVFWAHGHSLKHGHNLMTGSSCPRRRRWSLLNQAARYQ